MEKSHTNPYAALDQPQVLQFLFHPRRDDPQKAGSGKEHFIPVDQDIEVGAAFHLGDPSFPNILFFHGNADKIRHWNKPLLIIHAQFDHIIDFSEGEALYNLCSSTDKDLLMIPGANHNDIFIKGFDMYLNSLKNFLIPQDL